MTRGTIVDDAHASENYIAAQWTVRINRFAGEDETLFEAVAGLLNGLLTKANYVRLTGAAHSIDDVTWVDRIPTAQPADIDRIAGCTCRQCRAGPSSATPLFEDPGGPYAWQSRALEARDPQVG
jgi:hypothetical protein